MSKIKNMSELKEAILKLEENKINQTMRLKGRLETVYENTKPINLLKNTLKDASESLDIQETILSSGLNLTTGFLAKKLLYNKKTSKTKKVIGSALIFLLTKVVSENSDGLKKLGLSLLNLIKTKKESKVKS